MLRVTDQTLKKGSSLLSRMMLFYLQEDTFKVSFEYVKMYMVQFNICHKL